jgi:hypothetical protein
MSRAKNVLQLEVKEPMQTTGIQLHLAITQMLTVDTAPLLDFEQFQPVVPELQWAFLRIHTTTHGLAGGTPMMNLT